MREGGGWGREGVGRGSDAVGRVRPGTEFVWALALSLSLTTSTGRRADLWQANLLTIHDAMPRLPSPMQHSATAKARKRQTQKAARAFC